MTATEQAKTPNIIAQDGVADTSEIKNSVREVYEFIAAEYDDRIPGVTPADERFTESEMAFVLSKVRPSDRILDMGCGTGRFTVPMATIANQVVGLDLTPAMLEQARRNADKAGVTPELQQGDMCDLPFPDESFDLVTSMLALMHIPPTDRPRVFSEVSRVLRPGGRAVFGVKNGVFEQMSGVDRFASVDITDVAEKNLVFTQTRDGKDRVAAWHSFTPEDLNGLFATAGMIPVQLRGNSTLSVWIADALLADPGVAGTIRALESVLCDTAPFNRLGYHLLIEAIKPGRRS